MKVKDLVVKLNQFDPEIEIIHYDDEFKDEKAHKLQIDILGFNTNSLYQEYPTYIKLWFHYE